MSGDVASSEDDEELEELDRLGSMAPSAGEKAAPVEKETGFKKNLRDPQDVGGMPSTVPRGCGSDGLGSGLLLWWPECIEKM